MRGEDGEDGEDGDGGIAGFGWTRRFRFSISMMSLVMLGVVVDGISCPGCSGGGRRSTGVVLVGMIR